MVDIYTPEGVSIPFSEPRADQPELSEKRIDQLLRSTYSTYWGPEEGERQFRLLEGRKGERHRKAKSAQATTKNPSQEDPNNSLYFDPDTKILLEDIPAYAGLSPHHQDLIRFIITEGGTLPEDLPFVITDIAESLNNPRDLKKIA